MEYFKIHEALRKVRHILSAICWLLLLLNKCLYYTPNMCQATFLGLRIIETQATNLSDFQLVQLGLCFLF